MSSIAANLMDGIPISQDDEACRKAQAPPPRRRSPLIAHTRIIFIVTIRCRRSLSDRPDGRERLRRTNGLRNSGNGFAQSAEKGIREWAKTSTLRPPCLSLSMCLESKSVAETSIKQLALRDKILANVDELHRDVGSGKATTTSAFVDIFSSPPLRLL